MGKFHIRLVGGWCGNRMVMVRDNLTQLLEEKGYEVKIDQQSIWENYAPPQYADLILQLIPAFSPEELKTPSLLVRPFLKDLNHGETLEQVLEIVVKIYPRSVNHTNPVTIQSG